MADTEPPHDIIQLDPMIKELLLRKTGHPLGVGVSEEAAAEEIPVVARLRDSAVPVPGLRIVARFDSVVTGRVRLGRVIAVRSDPNMASLKVSRGYRPTLAWSVPEIHASRSDLDAPGVPGVTGRGTVSGFLDWGVDFAHSNMIDGRGTRLLYLWDQRGGPSSRSPAPYGYGREFSREEINAALQERDPYAALGYDPADADAGKGSHGAHVVDIAAGNGSAPGSSPGVAPEAELIFVHLSSDDTLPEDTLGDSVRLLEGVRYVFERAGSRPVVLNMSLGRTGGPHDASLLVVRGLDTAVVEELGRAVVMSAGNYYLADIHTHGRVPQNGVVDLRWVVVPRHAEYAEMEVWYGGRDRFDAELIDPSGRIVARVPLGHDQVVRERDRVLASVYHRRSDPNNGLNLINVFLTPDAPVGTWTTRLHGEAIEDGTYHAWIERDDPLSQSRFVSATVDTTLGSICSGFNTIAVGAYNARAPGRPLVPFSSQGPSRDARPKPDISAPGGGIRAARSSRRMWGFREMNGTTVKSGTSMAAPHVAGTVALMFEAAGNRPLSVHVTREILLATARPAPPTTPSDRLRYGAGRVDAAAAVREVLRRQSAVVQRAPVRSEEELPLGAGTGSAAPVEPSPRESPAAVLVAAGIGETDGGRGIAPAPPLEVVESPAAEVPQRSAPRTDGSDQTTPRFRCPPTPPDMPPATQFPRADEDPVAAARGALELVGLHGRELAAFERRGGFRWLVPLAALWGTAALAELLARLRYAPKQLLDPPSTLSDAVLRRMQTQRGPELVAPRVLLAIPGHFRQLARTVGGARDAHALESSGWVIAAAFRDALALSTRLAWWLPARPGFAGSFPKRLPVLEPKTTSLIAAFGLTDPSVDAAAYEARFASWERGPAGAQWRREVGLERDATGLGRPFYPWAPAPAAVDVVEVRTLVGEVWRLRLAEVDGVHPPLSDTSTAELTRCVGGGTEAALFTQVRLGGLQLVFDFPVLEGVRPFRSLRVLGALRHVFEAVFQGVADFGWNDLLFQCAGAACLRGVKLPVDPARPDRHGRAARVLSNHGYGIAVDVNTFENVQRTTGTMDPRIVALFESFGFSWGRCFPFPDPMHFEYG
jgi:subtilisin family serine protease